MAADGSERRDALEQTFLEARGCVRCPELAQTRNTVVSGAGNANADLMFIGEAPGRIEDQQGVPLAGAAGQLLEELLAEIGMAREDVFITNVLMCRPPDNRAPRPIEIDRCRPWLWRELELVRPAVVCTLGDFATRLLRSDPANITTVHGRMEERVLGPLNVRLLPLFHPAAALYTPASVESLREDFRQIPNLLALAPLQQVEPTTVNPQLADSSADAEPSTAGEADGGQLGLF